MESEKQFTFMELYRAGIVTKDDIDDYIHLWHNSISSEPLHEFLGMSLDSYKIWVEINEL